MDGIMDGETTRKCIFLSEWLRKTCAGGQREPVGNSSVSVCFVLTKWANGSFLFDYNGQWELLI